MRWPFGRPKTPGFGISKAFYLSVLSSRARLPSIVEVANPKGEGGAVAAFGAPLAPNSTKADLARPLARGAYAVASPDRRTVLRLIVVSKEEAGFDPEAFLRSPMAANVSDDMAVRIRATWTLLQLTFEAHDPDVYPALDFFEDVGMRLGETTDGVIADPLSQRYLMPAALRAPVRQDPRVDAREHVAVAFEAKKDGLHAYTQGMQKFVHDRGPKDASPLEEFEMCGFRDDLFREAESVLLGLCQAVLVGRMISEGDIVGGRGGALEARAGGLDRAKWEGVSAIELIPTRNQSLDEAIRAMASD